VIHEFRTTPNTPQNIVHAKVCAEHFQNLKSHQELMQQYNVGAYIDEHERMKKAAGRVGLTLPKVDLRESLSKIN